MQVLLQTAGSNAAAWQSALAAELPEAEIAVWPTVPDRVDHLLVWKPPGELFARVPTPKAIFNLGAGVDALLRLPTLPPTVPLIRLENAGMADQMVDYVTAAVLSAYRELPVYREQQRRCLWQPRAPLPKAAFTVGILGFGVLGQAVAESLIRFGFPVLAWTRMPRPDAPVPVLAGVEALPAFLSGVRVLVCLLPATPATIGLLNAERLAQLPAGAHLVNIARGDIVVDADLLAALDSGRLASATLDVFGEEPLPPGHAFWTHPRVTLTPHVSALTLVDVSARQIAAKIRRLEQGLAVTGVVDRGRAY